jgi:hypothetical protein
MVFAMAGPEIMHITYGVFRSFGIPALCIGIWIMGRLLGMFALCYLNGINTGLIGQVILQVSVYISSRGIKFAVSKSWVANDVNRAEAKVLAMTLSGS